MSDLQEVNIDPRHLRGPVSHRGRRLGVDIKTSTVKPYRPSSPHSEIEDLHPKTPRSSIRDTQSVLSSIPHVTPLGSSPKTSILPSNKTPRDSGASHPCPWFRVVSVLSCRRVCCEVRVVFQLSVQRDPFRDLLPLRRAGTVGTLVRGPQTQVVRVGSLCYTSSEPKCHVPRRQEVFRPWSRCLSGRMWVSPHPVLVYIGGDVGVLGTPLSVRVGTSGKLGVAKGDHLCGWEVPLLFSCDVQDCRRLRQVLGRVFSEDVESLGLLRRRSVVSWDGALGER